LEGHSDADAVAHALTDAILGAAAFGDIGRLFPDSDPQWKDADSMMLLRFACDRVVQGGFTPRQADITVILERPRLAPVIPAMIEGLSRATGIPVCSLSVKAKTNEGMGFIGRGEGISVMAVVTVEST
jgi:2-C-methyl-D-erythritol 2,4-cyclodiphosphate synthase